MTSNTADHSNRGTVLLCIFACLLLFFSHTAASTLSELDGQGALLLPHPREVYYRLRSSHPPLTIVSTLVDSIFPSSSLPYVVLSHARTLLTSVMASLFPTLGNLDVDLLPSKPLQSFPSIVNSASAANGSSSLDASSLFTTVCSSLLSSMGLPAWLVPEIGMRSLLPFLLVVGLMLYLHHDGSYRYMLHGNRPKLPLLPDLRVPPRLGHRVGSKRGRKLSAVAEEDDSSEDEEVDDMDSGMGLPAMCGLVRERGLDLMLRQHISEQQSQPLRCIAEDC